MFHLKTPFPPSGDQPTAIKSLVAGLEQGKRAQVLLGITGSGKTYTMANVIAKAQIPTLILAHNKTLAAQLYQEFKQFFPNNAVEYFVSYYDYYQPEAYIARSDTYIEKDMAINDKIDRLRLSATRSLFERDDVIIVSSVSCIYGLGMPEYYKVMNIELKVGQNYKRDELLFHLVEIHYDRNDIDFSRGKFRVRGDVLEVFPAYEEDLALRLEFFDEELERISEIDPLTGHVKRRLEKTVIYPGSHHVTPEDVRMEAIRKIEAELQDRSKFFEETSKLLERERILQRTKYDLEMLREMGFCNGIENYSRHFGSRPPGSPPPCLIDYFPENFLMIVDESHQTIPQLHAMANGDRARKQSLVEYGFRLPSAFDNRPLRFEEVYARMRKVIYVSATPSPWEVQEAEGEVVEQIIRPTGLLDPIIEVRPASGQIDDALEEIRIHTKKKGRVLVTTLTKKMSEELTQFLLELNIKAKYLHSDIDTLERTQIIQDLRKGEFEVLVGINLLREGLDIPEVSLVTILDADKQGFLRSKTSLIQTCGRAARNAEGRVIMYADNETQAIKETLEITKNRRKLQEEHNKKHGITPRTVIKEIGPDLVPQNEEPTYAPPGTQELVMASEEAGHYLSEKEIQSKIKEYEAEMKKAAKAMKFEEAARYRDLMHKFQQIALTLG
ncbi:MAG: uvrB [Chlamydiales bacterium]|jgi:excinuclease ABC subunit B|nr:uvrB [Chlamydiales bacterium]